MASVVQKHILHSNLRNHAKIVDVLFESLDVSSHYSVINLSFLPKGEKASIVTKSLITLSNDATTLKLGFLLSQYAFCL